MLEILSLVACGWLLMYNPTDDSWQRPSGWEQVSAFDSALECQSSITNVWKKKKSDQEKIKAIGMRCVPTDVVYPRSQPNK
jgi:hypothetical protein